MSLRPDGHYRCDKCGSDLGEGGGVDVATKVVGTDPDTGHTTVRQLDLCKAPRDGAPAGCTGNVLGLAALADYYETRSA